MSQELVQPRPLLKNSLLPSVIYGLFSILFLAWLINTYRSELHMDVMFIVSNKIKHLYEGNLHPVDFIYQPLFPGFTSICFTFLNAKFFHLNTVIEAVAGSICLIILGFKYLKEYNRYLSTPLQKGLFAALTAFIVFGLHKWEALFTPCFSFAVFFDLCICFFSYFFIINYLKPGGHISRLHLILYIFFNLLVISEAPAYFLSFIISVVLLLFLIRRYNLVQMDIKKWKNIFYLNSLLFLLTLGVVAFLSRHPVFKHFSSNPSITEFFQALQEKPIWMFKFYVLANTGPYLGEAYNYIEWRLIFGLGLLFTYFLAIRYVIKKKDIKLLIPLGMILSNLVSYGFVTMSRYYLGGIEYGSSSRYTVFNLSGVLGLVTIIFFYLIEEKEKRKRILSWIVMILILLGYFFLDKRQLDISSYRRLAFNEIRSSLLFGSNLAILQADTAVSKDAIAVLKKYHLNVYYENQNTVRKHNLGQQGKIILVPGTPSFEKLQKLGFNNYETDNGFSWTTGKASLGFDSLIVTEDTLVVKMNTWMPEICKNVDPKIVAVDENSNQVQLKLDRREGDSFYYYTSYGKPTTVQQLNILSNKIDAPSDQRILSFPFKGLEIGNHLK
jgi:hypothetical protein